MLKPVEEMRPSEMQGEIMERIGPVSPREVYLYALQWLRLQDEPVVELTERKDDEGSPAEKPEHLQGIFQWELGEKGRYRLERIRDVLTISTPTLKRCGSRIRVHGILKAEDELHEGWWSFHLRGIAEIFTCDENGRARLSIYDRHNEHTVMYISPEDAEIIQQAWLEAGR